MTFLEQVNELSAYLAANVKTIFDLEKMVITKSKELMPYNAVHELSLRNMRYDAKTNTLKGSAIIKAELSLSRYMPSIIEMNGDAIHASVTIDCSHYPLLEEQLRNILYSTIIRENRIQDSLNKLPTDDLILIGILSKYDELKKQMDYIKLRYNNYMKDSLNEVEKNVNQQCNGLIESAKEIGVYLNTSSELFEIPSINIALKKHKANLL